MSSDNGVIVQVNIKDGRDGNLYNVYARNADELEAGLNALAHYAAQIAETTSLLTAIGAVTAQIPVTAAPTPPPVAEVPAAGGWSQPTQAPQAPAKPLCNHGPRVGRAGSGAKGPWRAYFCPTPKGTPGQCEPVWLKQGSPEWASFVEG